MILKLLIPILSISAIVLIIAYKNNRKKPKPPFIINRYYSKKP